MVINPFIVLIHVVSDFVKLSIDCGVVKRSGSQESYQKHQKEKLEDADLAVIDVAVDGRHDLRYVDRVLKLLHLEVAHRDLFFVQFVVVAARLAPLFQHPLQLSVDQSVSFDASGIILVSSLF